MTSSERIGLIAGNGRFPFLVLDAARAQGYEVIVAAIKDSKKKAQASIQGDTVRVVSKDRDTLQEIMAMLKGKDIGVDLQFTNFRSN